jgi:hypothetical protein
MTPPDFDPEQQVGTEYMGPWDWETDSPPDDEDTAGLGLKVILESIAGVIAIIAVGIVETIEAYRRDHPRAR